MHEHERWNYWMLDLGVLYLEEGGVRVGDRRERREREDVSMFVDLRSYTEQVVNSLRGELAFLIGALKYA
jgi:hypothetical protein